MSKEAFQLVNWRSIEHHPLAARFRMMTETEREALGMSLCDSGFDQTFPIILHEGKILDGRNRHALCVELDVQPTFTEFEPEGDDTALDLVLRANWGRRHLSSGERDALAVELVPHFEAKLAARKAAKAREQALTQTEDGTKGFQRMVAHGRPSVGHEKTQTREPKAVDLAAAAVGSSGRSVSRMKRLKEQAPDLHEEVKEGKKKARQAENEMLERSRKTSAQKKRAETMERNRPFRELKKWHDDLIEEAGQEMRGETEPKTKPKSDPVPDHVNTLFNYYDTETFTRLVEHAIKRLPRDVQREIATRLLEDEK